MYFSDVCMFICKHLDISLLVDLFICHLCMWVFLNICIIFVHLFVCILIFLSPPQIFQALFRGEREGIRVFVFVYLCICVFVYLCICIFVYLCICVFVYLCLATTH